MKYFKSILPPVLLLAIIAYCFGRTLGSYFLADDFGEVCYVSRIFAGDLGLLFSNFTGNYMQIPTMSVYRPNLLVSLVWDYAFWRTNAFGYYLTNIAFMFGASMMLYLVLRRLTQSWKERNSVSASLAAAALFASNPLHSEAVSLVVGRVDIICSFFYLCSFWLFLKAGRTSRKVFSALAVFAFWMAMLTKEMSIGLPPLLTATAFIFPELFSQAETETGTRLRERIAIAFKTSLPLWISTVAYFVVRYLALGTLTGGYVGSVGASQFSHILDKWTDVDTVSRIFYPLNTEVFSPHTVFRNAYTCLYGALAALTVTRLIMLGLPVRWLAFLSVWTISTLLPVYQLWGLSSKLEGSRFLFFLTMPLAAVLPILLFAPGRKLSEDEVSSHYQRRAMPLAVACLAAFGLFNASIAYRNNVPWLHAGKQTRAVQQRAIELAQKTTAGKRVAVIGIPKERGGAHMILNGITFDIMLSPPFTTAPMDSKFITFDPILFGRSELINPQRLKDCLSDGSVDQFCVWNEDKLRFDAVPVQKDQVLKAGAAICFTAPPSDRSVLPYEEGQGQWQLKGDVLTIEKPKRDISLIVSPAAVDPFEYDFLTFEIRRTKGHAAALARAYWLNGEHSELWRDLEAPAEAVVPEAKESDFQTCRIPLSAHWIWFANGKVDKLRLVLPLAERTQIKNIRLVAMKGVMPKIYAHALLANNTGVFPSAGKVSIQVAAEQITGCHSVELQITKPNFFFESFNTGNTHEAVGKAVREPGAHPQFVLPPQDFSSPGYYQLRAVSLDADGKPIGEPSGPLTIYRTLDRLAGVAAGAG